MKHFSAKITKCGIVMTNYYKFEALSQLYYIHKLDEILLELFKTPLREVMPIVYSKLISQYIQEEFYCNTIEEYVINDMWNHFYTY